MSHHAAFPSTGRTPVLGALLLAALAAAPSVARGQSLADRLRAKAEAAAARAVETRVERRAREGTEGAIDAAEQGARRAAGSAAPRGRRDSATAPQVARRAVGAEPAPPGGEAAAPSSAAEPATALRPGEGAWANFDFVPGDRVLFADDFNSDVVGDFPRRLTFVNGSSELVVWEGRRWLRAPGEADIAVPLPQVLPERFTLEFDLAGSGNAMEIYFADPARHRGPVLRFDATTGGVRGGGLNVSAQTQHDTRREAVTVRIMADGPYVKAFVGETRVVNVPSAAIGRADRIWLKLHGWSAKAPRLITGLRVAAGGPDLYEALANSGRVATQGIYFETGSDRLRAESTPTLKAIAAMLAAHPDLRILVEGHTDAVGEAPANQVLSERRAAAVRSTLVAGFGADGARLTAAGRGASRPVAPNGTAEGRQMNRRVELVRQ